jgi:hypothetical protein
MIMHAEHVEHVFTMDRWTQPDGGMAARLVNQERGEEKILTERQVDEYINHTRLVCLIQG